MVKNGLRNTRTKRVGGVDIGVGHLLPFVDSYCFVPDAPDECCFFLGTLSSPNILPVYADIPGQGASPLGAAKIHLHVIPTNLVTSKLCGVLE